jgi:hypothetical protein
VHFVSFLPALIGAAIILIIGWFVAGLLARLIERALKAIGFESAVERSGIGDFIRRSGTRLSTSGVIATLVKYFIFLIFVQAAANVLGIPQLTEIINRIILFIPNVVIAMAIIVVGSLIARFLSGLVRSSVSELGVGSPNLLATLTQYIVIGFSVIAAIDQLGIAATLINTLLIKSRKIGIKAAKPLPTLRVNVPIYRDAVQFKHKLGMCRIIPQLIRLKTLDTLDQIA